MKIEELTNENRKLHENLIAKDAQLFQIHKKLLSTEEELVEERIKNKAFEGKQIEKPPQGKTPIPEEEKKIPPQMEQQKNIQHSIIPDSLQTVHYFDNSKNLLYIISPEEETLKEKIPLLNGKFEDRCSSIAVGERIFVFGGCDSG